ncbi:MAG: hypothetical protein ACWGSD_11115, partial [Thermodesulfobacteriota bacterium]
MKKLFLVTFTLAWLAAGCAGTPQTVAGDAAEPAIKKYPGKIEPGMDRQEVIVSLGPPMLVTRKVGQDTEFLVYHLPGNTTEGGETAPLYIAIDNGKVPATGSA